MLAVASAVAALGAGAQELDDLLAEEPAEEPAETSEAGEAAAGEEAEGEAAGGKKSSSRLFYLLPYCREVEGGAEVLVPGSKEWKAIEEGRYYPLGTVYRTLTPESRLRIVFGRDCEVFVRKIASFGTRVQAMGEQVRAVNLVSGTITLKVPNNLPEGAFSVVAPGFTAYNPAGESRYTYRTTGDGDEAVIRCVTAALSVKGRHFDVIGMRAANEIKIRTSQDLLFTSLHGQRGDVLVRLDQGRFQLKDYGTGEIKLEDRVLDWKLSPRTAVRIHRALPALGEKLAVTVMTFDAGGNLKNRCAFTEKTVEVNSGELGPTSKKDRDELARRAANIADTQDAEGANLEAEETEAAPADEEPAEDEGGSTDDEDLF